LVNGIKTIKDKDLANYIGQMDQNMLDNGKMIKQMVMDV